MKNYRKTNSALPAQAMQLKKRIGRNRRRAIWVGLLYLLGTIALAAIAIAMPLLLGMPLLTHELAPAGLNFYEVFLNMDLASANGMIKVINAALFAIVLLVTAINAFRTLFKLRWLFKKSANNEHGFNRNVYAMLDLGHIFSGSFAVVLINYFLIALLCQLATAEMMFLAALGVGVVIHVFGGLWGAKTAFYDIQDGQVIEQKRLVGRFAPFFRNFLQIGAVLAMMYFLLTVNAENAIFGAMMGMDAISGLLSNMDMAVLLPLALMGVAMICLIVLTKHATAITEYNMDGAHGSGMKTFRLFSLLMVLTVGGTVALKSFVMGNEELNVNLLIVAAIALVMFVVELIMRRMPKHPDEIVEKVKEPEEEVVSDEMSLNAFSLAYGDNFVADEGKEKAKKSKKSKKNKESTESNVGVQPYPFVPPMPKTTVNANGTTVQMCPYPVPYPVPYPQQTQATQQQPANWTAAMLPLVAAASEYSMLPYMKNSKSGGIDPNVLMSSGILPSEAMKELLSKNVPAKKAKKLLIEEDAPKKEKVKEPKAKKEESMAVVATPAPVVDPVPAPAPVVEKEPVVEEEEEIDFVGTVEVIKYDVDCPYCGKKLRVNSSAPYNRCPSCRKVFEVRKTAK